MKKKCFCAMALIALACTLPSLAIEEEFEEQIAPIPVLLEGKAKEDEIYSYSNYAESIESAGASVDIYTNQDIKKQGTPSLSEFLNQSASVQINNANGSLGSPSTIRMRGTDRIRLTIDGVRADRGSLTSPGVEPQFILMDDLERVEIIRGPQGNLAGTNASGGLIALQTRRGKGPFRVELGSEMGNLGTFKERFAFQGEKDGFDYYTGITWFKTDGGMRTNNLGKINNDDYNNLSVVTNLGKKVLDNKAEIRNVFRFARARKDIGLGYQQSYPYGMYESPNNYALNLDIMNTLSFAHNPNEKYNYDAKFSIYHNRSNNYILPDELSGDPTYTSISKINSTRMNFQTQHNYKIASWNTLSLGYNLEAESIDGRSKDIDMWNGLNKNSYSGSTLQNDVYINDLINIKDKLYIRGGARLSHHSDFGTYISPNASASLVLPTFKLKGAKTKFRASWGQSRNNPTLYQRFGTVNSAYMLSLANPNLKSEKMESYDFGLTQSFFDEKLSFDLGYFHSDYNNYIGYRGATDPITWMYVGQYENVDKATIQGVEGKITWEPKTWFKLVSSYTYTNSEDKATKTDLPSVPRNSFKTMAYWTPHHRINIHAGVVANSGRAMSTGEQADRTDGYVDVQVGANIKVYKNENTEISLRGTVYNLLDQDVSMYKQGPTIYYAPGVNFRLGMFMDYTIPERKKTKKENL
ncbi:MAG: TonB-dependent receptor [Candidatus Gastranaerophilales bacterium]|nr:TonB-dependent receptor [Candidatus Gastranaerophilales bacterium]